MVLTVAGRKHISLQVLLLQGHRCTYKAAIWVVLCTGHYGIFRSGVQHYTRASGHARLEGLQVPSDEIE